MKKKKQSWKIGLSLVADFLLKTRIHGRSEVDVMVSLKKSELEYINNFYEKEGKIEVKDIDKKERLCIVTIPVIDGQEDITDSHKVITIPIDYNYDGEDVDIYNVPEMLEDDDIHEILETIWETYK